MLLDVRKISGTFPFLVALSEGTGCRARFADYLQENCFDDYASGQRWAWRNNKYPNDIGWFVSVDNKESNYLPTIFEPLYTDLGLVGQLGQLNSEIAFLLRCQQLKWEDDEPIEIVNNAILYDFVKVIRREMT